MKQSLSQLSKNKKAKIVDVGGNIHTRRRLYELGFLHGENVQILFVSPKKNSYIVSVNNYTFAFRKNILDNIFVENI